jgi:hypothetical protein
MKDLCVPIPNFGEAEFAEIELKVGEKKTNYNFRVVSFPWDEQDDHQRYEDELSRSLARIQRLKHSIESYDKNWELIQIFNPLENANNIQVLYREKKKNNT